MPESSPALPGADSLQILMSEMIQEIDPRNKYYAPDAAEVLAEIYTRGDSKRIFPLAYYPDENELKGELDLEMVSGLDKVPRAILLARLENRPVQKHSSVLYLDAAFTRPMYRGRGYMVGLFERARKWGERLDADVIELGVLTENKDAMRFWEKRGFSPDFTRLSFNL